MQCDEVKYYIKDFAQGYLIDEMRKLIGDHLENCASCRTDMLREPAHIVNMNTHEAINVTTVENSLIPKKS